MVEGRDENPMDDGPEGAQDEPIQDGRNRPRQAAGLSDDPPHERDKADREQEEEHETGPQDSTLMGAPSLPQKGAAATERFHRPDAFEDQRREHEQGRDGPAVSEDPRYESSARVGANRGEPDQDADGRREERPDEDLEEARVRRRDSVEHVRPLPLKPDGSGPNDCRHEVDGEEVRHQVCDEDLLVQEAARWRCGREAQREDAQDDDEPYETGEDEGQEREGHHARLSRKDAQAPESQVEPAGELGPESSFRSRFMVSLPTPLRRVHPGLKKGGSHHKFIAGPAGIDKGESAPRMS